MPLDVLHPNSFRSSQKAYSVDLLSKAYRCSVCIVVRRNKLDRWKRASVGKALAGEAQHALQRKQRHSRSWLHIEPVIRALYHSLAQAVPRFRAQKSPHQALHKALHGNHGETQAPRS